MMQLTSVATLLTTAFSIFQGVQAQGDFSQSCTGVFIQNNNILRATCGNGSGGQVNSALDLNACISISGNNLVCQPK